MSNFPSGEDYTNAHNTILSLSRQKDDMAMLIRRLARALNNARPGSALPEQAMDYLKRHGLDGSPLRKP